MKAGNISPAAEQAQLVPGVKMQGNVDSYAQSKAGSLGRIPLRIKSPGMQAKPKILSEPSIKTEAKRFRKP